MRKTVYDIDTKKYLLALFGAEFGEEKALELLATAYKNAHHFLYSETGHMEYRYGSMVYQLDTQTIIDRESGEKMSVKNDEISALDRAMFRVCSNHYSGRCKDTKELTKCCITVNISEV